MYNPKLRSKFLMFELQRRQLRKTKTMEITLVRVVTVISKDMAMLPIVVCVTLMDRVVIAKIKMIRFTTKIEDIEMVVPLNLMPLSSFVRYFSKVLLEQKQTGVSIPKSTGTQMGSSSPSFNNFGASL